MLNNQQKAESVVAALEEASPQLLAKLAKEGGLLPVLADRVQRFNLELVRKCQNLPEDQQDLAEESLLPMLTEFPQSSNQKPLSKPEQLAVSHQLAKFLASLPKPILHPSLKPAA